MGQRLASEGRGLRLERALHVPLNLSSKQLPVGYASLAAVGCISRRLDSISLTVVSVSSALKDSFAGQPINKQSVRGGRPA